MSVTNTVVRRRSAGSQRDRVTVHSVLIAVGYGKEGLIGRRGARIRNSKLGLAAKRKRISVTTSSKPCGVHRPLSHRALSF